MNAPAALIATRDAINRALPIAYADENRAPHRHRLFVSREYVDLRWSLFQFTGEGGDFDLFIGACRQAGIDPDVYLERELAA